MSRTCVPVAALALALASLVAASGAQPSTRQVPAMLVFEQGGDLYRMTVDGSETVRLTATKAEEAEPAASPDGLRLAFTRGTTRVRDALWASDVQGKAQHQIVGARPPRVKYATTNDPAWSQDGRTIVLARAAQGPNEICGWIYRVGADGRGLTRVTRGVRLDSDPAPSPDGTRIALSEGECEPGLECCSLTIVDTRGKPTDDLRNLPAIPGAQFAPSWSADGSTIAFEVSDPDAGQSAIYVVDRDGSHLRKVTPRGLDAEEPAWSPEGEWIAFAAWTRSSSYDLYVIRPDGTGLRRLTRTRTAEHSPAWIARS